MPIFKFWRTTTVLAANEPIANGGRTYKANAASAAQTHTVAAPGKDGRELYVVKSDTSTNTVTLTLNLDGVAGASIVLANKGDAVKLYDDGTTWTALGNRPSAASLAATYLPQLPPLATVTTAATPTVGSTQPYNATSGALAPTLPALSGLAAGTTVLGVQKDEADTSINAVAVTAAGSDTFTSGATSLSLRVRGELRTLQVVSIAGTKYWKVIDGNTPLSTLVLAPQRLRNAFSGAWHAEAFGMAGDAATTSTDNSIGLAALIAAVVASGDSFAEIRCQPGEYAFKTAVPNFPPAINWVLRGMNARHVGTSKPGVRWRLGGGYLGPVLKAYGTAGPASPDSRVHLRVQDIDFNGNGYTATDGTPLLQIGRCSETWLERVSIGGFIGTGLRMTEWFNSGLHRTYFYNLGSGTTYPAVLMDSPGTAVTDGASGNTIHLSSCEWEGNGGTDLRITGNDTTFSNGQDWTIFVGLTNCKMERNTGAYPMFDLDRVGALHVSDSSFHLGPDATAAHIWMRGTACQPARPIKFATCEFSANKWTSSGVGGAAAIPYFIDMTAGVLELAACSMNGSPTTAFVHVGSTVGLGDLRAAALTVTNRAILVNDERGNSVWGYGTIPLTPTAGVTATTSVNRPIWNLVDGSTTSSIYANVKMPADAAVGRPLKVRVHWYSDVAGGNVRFDLGYKALAANAADITAGQADVLLTEAAPATANTTKSTVFTMPSTVSPDSGSVSIFLSRIGADAADTNTGGARVLSAELLYERAL